MTIGPHAILTAEAACSGRVADSQPPVACVRTQAQLTSQGTRRVTTELQILSGGAQSLTICGATAFRRRGQLVGIRGTTGF